VDVAGNVTVTITKAVVEDIRQLGGCNSLCSSTCRRSVTVGWRAESRRCESWKWRWNIQTRHSERPLQ